MEKSSETSDIIHTIFKAVSFASQKQTKIGHTNSYELF